jgi:hypothetical protein
MFAHLAETVWATITDGVEMVTSIVPDHIKILRIAVGPHMAPIPGMAR